MGFTYLQVVTNSSIRWTLYLQFGDLVISGHWIPFHLAQSVKW